MRFTLKALALLAAVSVLGACSIQRHVQSVDTDDKIKHVCIQNAPATKMSAYQPMLQRLIQNRGITTEIYNGAKPDHCEYHLTYVANWSWDGAMYLRYNNIDVYRNNRNIGKVEYKAGLMSLAKWGKTESKVAPLVAQLFP